jgi:hypothetical protein
VVLVDRQAEVRAAAGEVDDEVRVLEVEHAFARLSVVLHNNFSAAHGENGTREWGSEGVGGVGGEAQGRKECSKAHESRLKYLGTSKQASDWMEFNQSTCS